MARGQNANGGSLASIKSKKPTSRQKIRKAHFARKELENTGNDSFRRMTRLSAQALEPITLDLGFAPKIVRQRRVLLYDEETEEDEPYAKDELAKQQRAYGGAEGDLLSALDFPNLVNACAGPSASLNELAALVPSPIGTHSPEAMSLDPNANLNLPDMIPSSSPIFEDDDCTLATPLYSVAYPAPNSIEQKRFLSLFFEYLDIPDAELSEFEKGFKDATAHCFDLLNDEPAQYADGEDITELTLLQPLNDTVYRSPRRMPRPPTPHPSPRRLLSLPGGSSVESDQSDVCRVA